MRRVDGELKQVAVPVADLCSQPGGARDKQLVHGQRFDVLEDVDGWAFGFDPVDGYVGYLASSALGPVEPVTHVLTARSGHIYSEPDFKSPDIGQHSFGAMFTIVRETEGYLALSQGGWLSAAHASPLDALELDPVEVAERFLHTPYLWGGNTGFGIDCSGLVSVALRACGIACPRDSDLQARDLGTTLAQREDLRRGDLVFWKGHVGMMQDPDTLLHANAHHMSVASEPLDGAIARIGRKEFGEVTRFARVSG